MLLILVLAIALASGSATADVATPEDWAPMNAFVGEWDGTRVTPTDKVKVSRRYEPAEANHHLQITEKVDGHRSPWGVVRFDAAHRIMVLSRTITGDTPPADLFLTAVSEDRSRLVFTAERSDGSAAERLTLQRNGWNEFVERYETAAEGDFKLIYETRFRREQ